MSRPGQLAHGRTPGDANRQFADRFNELDRRLREVTAMATTAITAAKAAEMSPTWFNQHQNGIDFSTTATDYPLGSITAPAGFTRMLFNMTASAGATFSTGASISVSAFVVIAGSWAYGDSIGTGIPNNAACSVSASFANYYTVAPGDTITFGGAAIIDGTQTSGSGNVHASALVLFLR